MRVVNRAYFIVFLFWFFFLTSSHFIQFFAYLCWFWLLFVSHECMCHTYPPHFHSNEFVHDPCGAESFYFILLSPPPPKFGDGMAFTHISRQSFLHTLCAFSTNEPNVSFHILLVFFFFSLFVSLPFGFVHSFHCTTYNHIVSTLFNKTLLRKVWWARALADIRLALGLAAATAAPFVHIKEANVHKLKSPNIVSPKWIQRYALVARLRQAWVLNQ